MKCDSFDFSFSSFRVALLLIECPQSVRGEREIERKKLRSADDDGAADDASQKELTHLNDTVLRAGGDNVIVVRTPSNVKDGTFVAANKWMVSWNATDLSKKKESN